MPARFFPHEIADLSVVLDYISATNSPVQEMQQWPLRYAMLLWLSLICMIPFDLEQFDEVGHSGETASRIEAVAKLFLGRAGVDREGAALLLSRLYMRYVLHNPLSAYSTDSQQERYGLETSGVPLVCHVSTRRAIGRLHGD